MNKILNSEFTEAIAVWKLWLGWNSMLFFVSGKILLFW